MAVLNMQSALSSPYLVPAAARGIRTCAIVHAHSEDGLLTWSYTSGLDPARRHPEFLISGLDPFLAESVLRQLVDRVAQGETFTEVSAERNLLHRLTCAFREVPGAMASILMPLAGSIVDGQSPSALQCIYPDHHNRLPWHMGYHASWQETQPIFNFETPLSRSATRVLRAAAGIDSQPAHHLVEIPA